MLVLLLGISTCLLTIIMLILLGVIWYDLGPLKNKQIKPKRLEETYRSSHPYAKGRITKW